MAASSNNRQAADRAVAFMAAVGLLEEHLIT
jgi:hypothetical protein